MTDSATPGITRHFVTLDRRQIHYRRGGSGPALVMLHRLPRSSKDLVPVMQSAMTKFTVIAPDLAGYGNSNLLPNAAPTVADYAADVAALIAALGIKRCLLYGEGEGGAIALVLAAERPELIAALAVQSLPAFDPLNTAPDAWPPFVPTWDGCHLAWLWAMLREENVFAPPGTKRLATRIDAPMPPPAELQSRAVQFVTGAGQGRHYHLGFAAMVGFDPGPIIARLTVPTLFTGAWARHDHIALEKLDALIGGRAALADTVATARTEAFTFFARHSVATPPPPPPPAVKPVLGQLWSDFVPVPDGQLHVRMNGEADTVPLVVQHDAASSVDVVAPITASFVGRRRVMAFDMPGSGESDRTIGDTVEVRAYAETLAAALDHLGLKQIDFYGMWGGGFVGLELALANPTRVRRLVMSNLFQHNGDEQRAFQAYYTPDVAPHWHGGHLLQCWHQMRDQGLYYPWFETSLDGIIRREPFIGTDMVHGRVCALMKAGNMYRTAYQAHFRYRTYDRLRRSPVPTLIATAPWDPNNPHTHAAAKAAPNVHFRVLDNDFAKWGPSFIYFLEAETV